MQPINFVVYLLCKVLITATCALLAAEFNYHQGSLPGFRAEFLLSSQLEWNAEAGSHPLCGVSHQDQILCLSSLVRFELSVRWTDSRLTSWL